MIAERLALREVEKIDRQQKRERRKAFVSHLVSHGFTENQAECCYGIGPGCQSIDWVALKHKIEREVSYAQEYLTMALNANNHQETARYATMFFPEENKTTMKKKCYYALEIFFNGKKKHFSHNRDFPVVGKGWEFVNP